MKEMQGILKILLIPFILLIPVKQFLEVVLEGGVLKLYDATPGMAANLTNTFWSLRMYQHQIRYERH